MIKITELLSVDHGHNCKNFVFFEFVEVRQNDMPDDIVVKSELQRTSPVFEWFYGIQFIYYLSDESRWQKSIVLVMYFCELYDC